MVQIWSGNRRISEATKPGNSTVWSVHRARTGKTGIKVHCHTVEYAGFVASEFEGHVTEFAPHKALKLIA